MSIKTIPAASYLKNADLKATKVNIHALNISKPGE